MIGLAIAGVFGWLVFVWKLLRRQDAENLWKDILNPKLNPPDQELGR